MTKISAISPQKLGLSGDGPLANALGVINYEDVAEKLLRTPGMSPITRLYFRRKIDACVMKERRLLFVHVPKNAGTSVSASVYGRSSHHRTALFYKTVTGDLFVEAKVFAVLREPVDRFISSFWFVRNGGGEDIPMGREFGEICRGVETPDHLLNLINAYLGNIYLLDHSLRPQSWYVTDTKSRTIVPNLFVLNEHDEALATFLVEHGKPAPPRRNVTKKGMLRLTEAQESQVRSLYAADVSLVEAATRRRF